MANKLRQARIEQGLSLRELADQINEMYTPPGKTKVHFTTLGKLEKGDRPLTHTWLFKIASILDVADPYTLIDSLDDLIDGEEIRRLNQGTSSPEVAVGARLRPVRRIPVVGTIAAGNWREAIERPIGWVAGMDVGENAFGLLPEGTSMSKVFTDNAYMIVDPDETALLDGKIYAVRNEDGDTTVKRFRVDPARLVPESDDEQHKPILLGSGDVMVIGRVILKVTPV